MLAMTTPHRKRRWLLPASAAAEVVAEVAVTFRCEDGGMIVGQDDGICVSATLGAVAVSKEGVEQGGPRQRNWLSRQRNEGATSWRLR